jgi:hypothetical protein
MLVGFLLGLLRNPGVFDGACLTVAVVHLKRRPVVYSMLVGFLLGLLRNPGVFDGACLTVAALLQHQEV